MTGKPFNQNQYLRTSIFIFIVSMGRKDLYKPEPPKKPMCAFFLYRMDVYPLVKDQFPGYRMT